MKRALLASVLLAMSSPAAAQSSPAALGVAQARASGLVGERYDGYLGLVGTSSPTLARHVGAVNLLRRSLYAQLSRSRGVSMQEIGITAGCQLLGTVRVGERYYGLQNGWRVRIAGQPVPIPNYCR